MGYCTYHSSKGSGGGGGLGNHIDRVEGKEHTFENADPERKKLNKNLTPRKEFAEVSMPQAIAIRMEEGYKSGKAIRKDAVRYIDHVLTGTNEDMLRIAKDPELLEQWAQKNLQFVKEEFGAANIVRFVLHMDETTPHIHAVTVPLTSDGRLSAKEIIGNPVKLRERQDKYANMMAEFGLERGIERTGIRHEDAKEYYARIKSVNKETADIPTAVTKIVDDIKINPLNINAAKSQIKAQISTFVTEKVKNTGAELIGQNSALKREFKAKEVKQVYADLVNVAAKLKTDIPVSDYLNSLVASKELRFDGRHGAELYYALPRQRTGSISVNPAKNLFFDHSTGKGGDLITAVKHFEGKGFTDAVLKLSGSKEVIHEHSRKLQSRFTKRTSAVVTEVDGNSLPPSPVVITAELEQVQHPALVEYLNKRRLKPQDVKGLLKEVHWNTGDGKRLFGLGMKDLNNNYAIRSEGFKGKLGSMDISTFTIKPTAGGEPKEIKVFEGAFDLLAYRKLNVAESFVGVVLHTVGKAEKTVDAILKQGSYQPNQIKLYFDNDKAGQAATKMLQAKYPGIRDGAPSYAQWKDIAARWEFPQGYQPGRATQKVG